jgi:hypothetical protein
VADAVLKQEQGLEEEELEDNDDLAYTLSSKPTFETELSGKMGELRIENGAVRFLGAIDELDNSHERYRGCGALDKHVLYMALSILHDFVQKLVLQRLSLWQTTRNTQKDDVLF